jgi:hypothetical protein
MPVLIALKLLAGNALSAVLRFLKGASAWQLVALALAGLCIILWFQRNDARSDAARWQKQDAAHVAELQRISSAKNEQRAITREKIKLVETKRVEADREARKIEQAPLPGQCRTPPEVLGAGL